MRLSARKDTRFAGDALTSDQGWSITPEIPTRWQSDGLSSSADTYIPGYREGFVGEGAYGRVWQDEPGLVRKEINLARSGKDPHEVLEEANAQLVASELGIAPRIASYESATYGDPQVQTLVMQDLNAPGPSPQGTPLYRPMENMGEDVSDYGLIIQPHMHDLAKSDRPLSDRKFALKHFQQMGHLALKGIDPMDRHAGNVFKHEMTGRPMQIDFGLARQVKGEDKVQSLLDATVGGFQASGQSDVAEIINDTAWDYLNGGQVKEAWDFTREAFANLQKIKKPIQQGPQAS